MDKAHSIRHLVLTQGKSRRWVARELKVSRRTVDRYVDGEVEPGRRKATPRPAPVRERAAAALEKVIAETRVANKQRLTAKRAHELLGERKVSVGYTVVKELLRERRLASAEVHVPLVYVAGDLAEVDFFEVEVVVAAEQVTAYLFVMRLMSSGRDFVHVYPRQDQVCFLDGHVRAFEYFGIPARVAYDNLKAAVLRHLVGSERELQPRFHALATHYAIEACFCRPYTGHDKGGVESRGKNIRLQSMVPLPEGGTLSEVSAKVLADVERRYFKKKDAGERWTPERAALRSPPDRAFDPRRTLPAVPVCGRSLVTVEGAKYSVPSTWARRSIVVHAGVHDVTLVGPGGEKIERSRIPKGQFDIDYAAHYLDVLSKKPQALRQVAPVLIPQLGDPFPRWWTRLFEEHGPIAAARLMARILGALSELGRDETVQRVEHSFETGEALATCLLVAVAEPEAPSVMVPPTLDVNVEASTVSHFDALLGGAQ